jgi:hypothetical protein
MAFVLWFYESSLQGGEFADRLERILRVAQDHLP